MMSKISSFKMYREDMKHRFGILLLSMFLFLMKDLFLFISLENTVRTNADNADLILNTIISWTEMSTVHLFYIVPFAALMAVSTFRYLHNKRQVDFYHALPIKRGQLFGMFFANDLLIFLIPYGISMLIHTGIVAQFRPLDHLYAGWLLWGIVGTILAFFATYLLMVLSMLLTGQTSVAILAFGVFVTYFPVVLLFLLQSYAATFFKTYWLLPDALEAVLMNLSPIAAVVKICGEPRIGEYGIAVCWVIVLLAVDYILFQKRHSESAGTAMAFRQGQKLIKVLVTIPMAMYTGNLFYDLTMKRTMLWLYFGVILGAVLFHGLVECIYRTDIRGLWANKKELAGILLVTFLVLFGFEMDFLGFDRYAPTKENVVSVQLDNVLRGSVVEYGTTPGQEAFTGEEKDIVLDALEEIRQNMPENEEEMDSYEDVIHVSYRQANKKTHYRTYQLTRESREKLCEQLMELDFYKEQIYPIFKRDLNTVLSIVAEHPLLSMQLPIMEKEQIIEMLKQDLLQLTYEEAVTENPVCKIRLEYASATQGEDTISECYDIYPSCTNTIRYIKEHGGIVSSSLSDVEVTALKIASYLGDESYIEKTITDQKLIREVQDKLWHTGLESNLFYHEAYYNARDGYIEGIIHGNVYSFSTDDQTWEELLTKIK